MTNRDRIFRKRLTELFQWFDPNFKLPKTTARDFLDNLKNIIENSNDPSYLYADDRLSDEDDFEVNTKSPKKYPVKIWTCETCNKTMSIYNKCNHNRSKMHINKVMKRQD